VIDSFYSSGVWCPKLRPEQGDFLPVDGRESERFTLLR
jgi:hypothetical protein